MQSRHLFHTLLIFFIISTRVDASSEETNETDSEYYYDDDYSSTMFSTSPEGKDVSLESEKQLEPQTTLIDSSITSTTPFSLFAPIVSLASLEFASNLTTSILSNIVTTQPIFGATVAADTGPERDTSAPTCPDVCECNESRIVNCSNKNLIEIPSNLPNTATRIDLSHNQIKQLNVSQLEHCIDLKELLLQKNQIEAIVDKQKFTELHHLHHIDLSKNLLSTLDGDEFYEAKNLTNLSLSHNAIQYTNDAPILNVTNLKILNLVGCNLSEFKDNTFSALPTLLSLDLRENPIEPNINVDAFKPLVNLRSLRLPSVNSSEMFDLCSALGAIDEINTSDFDLSCFTYVAGEPFEESTITAGPPTSYLNPIDRSSVGQHVTATANAIPEIPSSTANTGDEDEPKTLPTGKQINETINDNQVITATNSTDSKSKKAQFIVPPDTIKLILIVIVAIAILGLIIGVICRRDWCGIKTKMCRKHRRPATTDQVRPAEEVPLNKV